MKTGKGITTQPAVGRLGVEEFARLLGIGTDEFSEEERDAIRNHDFSFRRPDAAERDAILLRILKLTDSRDLPVSGKKRQGDWEKGWAENLDAFIRGGFNQEALVPRYLRPDQPVRLFREYVYPSDKHFELNFYTVFRSWLYRTHLADAHSIFEFGCGTGYNLVVIAGLFPQKKLFGLDWAESSVNLVNRIGAAHSLPLTGIRFDMFAPDNTLEVPAGSAFLTMNSLEQLGSDHERLVRFLLDKRPSLCVHAEPLIELYDQENLPDYLAIRYHQRRGYLTGFVRLLRDLQAEGKVTILRLQRVEFGSMLHEGYSLLVWKPAMGREQ